MSTMRASSLASCVTLMATAAGLGLAALVGESTACAVPTKPTEPNTSKLFTRILCTILSLEKRFLRITRRVCASGDGRPPKGALLRGEPEALGKRQQDRCQSAE